jgi:mandelate racemase
LTDIFADDGTVGHGMIFTYAATALKPTADLIKNLESFVMNEPLAPADIADKFAKRFRLLGLQGLIAMAVAAIDMALWSALARSHNTSLARLLGTTESRFPHMERRGTTASQVRGSLPKLGQSVASNGGAKIGYATVEEDLAVVRAMWKANLDESCWIAATHWLAYDGAG